MTMKKRLPKVILFDLDDTIISFSGSSETCWQEVCALYAGGAGLTPERLLAAILEYSQWYWGDTVRHKRGRLDLRQGRREVVAGAFQSLKIVNPALANEIADAFSDRRETSISLFPGAVETLIALRSQGVRLGLITNGDSVGQRRKIDRFGLEPYFDYIQIEEEAGIGKPEPGVYELALQRLGVGPEETWMVGDNLVWDIEAAQKAGILAIWVDFAGTGLPAEGSIRPDRVIRSITELGTP
jgi:putative hydrolase of the HAD superfamily